GQSKKAENLGRERIIQIIDELYQAKSAKNAGNVNEVSLYFMRQVDGRAANEPTECVEEKTCQTKGRERELKATAPRGGEAGRGLLDARRGRVQAALAGYPAPLHR
ncbi:MAG TPA: hypothetical protein VMF65_06500, partial [Acidimicrobiales bacterium]|nr:hypothetical protein [Acidimicrobiales bacterium]